MKLGASWGTPSPGLGGSSSSSAPRARLQYCCHDPDSNLKQADCGHALCFGATNVCSHISHVVPQGRSGRRPPAEQIFSDNYNAVVWYGGVVDVHRRRDNPKSQTTRVNPGQRASWASSCSSSSTSQGTKHQPRENQRSP